MRDISNKTLYCRSAVTNHRSFLLLYIFRDTMALELRFSPTSTLNRSARKSKVGCKTCKLRKVKMGVLLSYKRYLPDVSSVTSNILSAGTARLISAIGSRNVTMGHVLLDPEVPFFGLYWPQAVHPYHGVRRSHLNIASCVPMQLFHRQWV